MIYRHFQSGFRVQSYDSEKRVAACLPLGKSILLICLLNLQYKKSIGKVETIAIDSAGSINELKQSPICCFLQFTFNYMVRGV